MSESNELEVLREKCAERLDEEAKWYADQIAYETAAKIIRALDLPLTSADAHDPGHPHLIDGEFQSDKYPTCPRGKVPLSVKDKTAQDLLWEYAQRRRAVDAEFAADLEIALTRHGYIALTSAREVTDIGDTALIACLRALAVEEKSRQDEELARQMSSVEVRVQDMIAWKAADRLKALASAPQPACVGVDGQEVFRRAAIRTLKNYAAHEGESEHIQGAIVLIQALPAQDLSPAPSPQAGGEDVTLETVHAAIRKLGTLYGAAGHDLTTADAEGVTLEGMPVYGWRKAYREGIKDASGCVLAAFPETMHADLQAIAKTAAQEEFDRCGSDPALSARREG